MGAQDEDTATNRLSLLQQHFREHPRTTPPAGPRTRAVHPGTPANLAVIDHIATSVREVADYTRQNVPDAQPLPERVQDVYRWCIAQTEHAPQDVQQRRDTIVYRQRLEHAIAMGDTSVIRPHRCPACNTMGLMWRDELQKVLCTNRRCLTKQGMSRTWSLARLAYEHVAVEKTLRGCAT